MENGLPQNTVQALAQTRDGFIWLGTEVGLVRFDGSGFATFDRNSNPALPGSDVQCLLATQDGSLWVGTSEGLARMKDRLVTAWTTANGLPANSIRSLRQDQRGEVIASTGNGEIGVEGTHLVPVQSDKLQGASVLFDLRLADRSHVLVNKSAVTVELPKSGQNQHWTVGKELPGTRIQTAFADREGTLWIGTNAGLARWVPGESGGKLQLLSVTDPLAHASILALMEDSEGDIWVGTEADGLQILRDQRFKTFGAREGLSSDTASTVVEDASGKLWVGTTDGGLNEIERTAAGEKVARTYTVRDGLMSDVILSLAAAPNEDLWAGTPDGLSRIHSGRIGSFTMADGLPDDFARSLLVDADGSLWVGTRRGLTHWTGGTAKPRMETYSQSNGLGSDLVGAMARDLSGNLWIATLAGLSRIENGKIVNYTTADGLSSNVITALLPRALGTLLIGTQDHGWNLWDGRRFTRATGNGLDQTTIHAILDDGIGHLWFATGNGIARCDCNEGMGGMTDASCSHWIEFGTADGLRSRETATNSHPSAWRSRDGLLWFATPKGLVEVDPAHFPVNAVPPPVEIERFAADDKDESLRGIGAKLIVPAGHVHFQFDYAGMSYVAPQKVRYRYMLEGFDKGWTDAGPRRTAYYTNIPPGRYTFRVQAANNDGLWNTAGTSLEFELRPHFYQTLWFYVLVVLVAAALVFLLIKRRLSLAESEFRAVLAERNRIAREIHDTLAQGYVGISLKLEMLAELLRAKKLDAAEKHLDTTRDYVREGLADARQSIWALRSQDTGEQMLPVRLRRLVESAGHNGFEAKLSIFGAYRPLPPGTEREFVRVAQEAIHNVNKHAGARNLAVRLEYGRDEIALEVKDDGRGFAAEAEPESPPGHFGLTGMRERARAVGGTLQITSEPGSGTTVRLEAPAPRTGKENH
jgi:signal transduction histidine kinase/ligand-binding sensor domain-containing protein